MKSLIHLQNMVDLESLYASESVPEVLAAFKVELQKACGSAAIVLLIGKNGGDLKVVHTDEFQIDF